MNHFRFLSFTYSVILFLFFQSCNPVKEDNANKKYNDSIALRQKVNKIDAPFLSPSDALKLFRLEKGFDIKLVASEPLIQAPVSIKFDRHGRIWGVEMQGYMPDTLGTGEDKPTGKIVILEDRDGDGIMDSRKIFMDSLVLPRAICLFEDGILIAEPPKLWFVENNQDRAGKKLLVDDQYAAGGNVEHQANGLLRGVDNWIYNAKSNMRYRRTGKNTWIKERTLFRGQWGISQDDFGRLYYNTNSDNLFGDLFTPGIITLNPNQKERKGFHVNVVPDNRTYPIRPTPGVNRGYMKEVLDDSFRLVNFTAACSPLVFRTEAFGEDYYNNVFVAEPSANLIKRNILEFTGNITEGKQAYKNQEFLASTDERFRPVDFAIGNDEALYIVDMYRGIIQHSTYLTEYLKDQIKMRDLHQPLNCGRIYKIIPKNKSLRAARFDTTPGALLSQLSSQNIWLRETAKNYIIDKQLLSVVPGLEQLLKEHNNIAVRISAFWTLEGLNRLSKETLVKLVNDPSYRLQQQALTAIVSTMKRREDASFWTSVVDAVITQRKPDSLLISYFTYVTSAAMRYDAKNALPVLLKIAGQYKNDPYVASAIISGLENREEEFLKKFIHNEKDTVSAIAKQLQKVIGNIERQKNMAQNDKLLDKNLVAGKKLFETICQTCHGNDGNGIKSLGPPLVGSEWVSDDKNKLIRIVLFGLTGPIKVGGKLYTQPEIANEMPGIGSNTQLTDNDIANILSYIRTAWGNNSSAVTAKEILRVRNSYPNREQPFTMEELQK